VDYRISGRISRATDVLDQRVSDIFAKDREPSICTLRNWTNLRRITHHQVGHFI